MAEVFAAGEGEEGAEEEGGEDGRVVVELAVESAVVVVALHQQRTLQRGY